MSHAVIDWFPWNDAPLLEAPPPPPPTQDELPTEDGIPMETQRHKLQMDLLIDPLDRRFAELGEGYVNGNMFLYFTLEQAHGRYFRGPDVFVVTGASRETRKSWVIWQENRAPDVVIELLSASTEAVDKGEKMRVYRDVIRVPEYFWYDPFDPDSLRGFRLVGTRYEPIAADAAGRLPSAATGLVLTRWHGTWLSVTGEWLRWAEPDGTLLPTYAEAERARAEAERARAEAERARAEAESARAEAADARAAAERQRAEALAAELARLRAQLGDPPTGS